MNTLQRKGETEFAGMQDPVFEAAGVGLALLDFEGLFLRVNPALAGLFDMAEAEFLGQRLYDYCPPTDAGTCFDMIQELSQAEGAVQDQELRLKPRGKQPLWVHVTASRLNGSVSFPSCIVLTVHDSSDYFELLEEM